MWFPGEVLPDTKYLGKYKGYVRDNSDPERRGRVRCYCPQVMGEKDDDKHWTGWALPCLPWLGGINVLDSGPPYTREQNGGREVGVWLEFEDGNVDFPIWVGTFIPAPSPSDIYAQIDLSTTSGEVGGSLLNSPPAGSVVSDINPPAPQTDSNEARLVVRAGREILLLSDQGGSVLIGPYGVAITGINITFNGRSIFASPAVKP